MMLLTENQFLFKGSFDEMFFIDVILLISIGPVNNP